MLCPVVPFQTSTSAATIRRPVPAATRDDLGPLIDGLQVLALTRPIAVVVIKKLVLGLLADSRSNA
jgi:hypothetical protein